MESQEARPDIEIGLNEDIKPAGETEFAGKNEFIGAITGNSEITEKFRNSESPEIKNPEFCLTEEFWKSLNLHRYLNRSESVSELLNLHLNLI